MHSHIGNSLYGQKGNQLLEVDCQLSILDLWRWRRITTRYFGALRVARLLIGVSKTRLLR